MTDQKPPTRLTFYLQGAYQDNTSAGCVRQIPDCLHQTVNVHPKAQQVQFTVENNSTLEFKPSTMHLSGVERKEFTRIISIAVARAEQLKPDQILSACDVLGKDFPLPALKKGQGVTILFGR